MDKVVAFFIGKSFYYTRPGSNINVIRVVPELEILTILLDLTTKFTKADKKCGNKIY